MSASEPLSPCIGLCVLDPKTGYCRGCWRSIEEITGWLDYSADEKRRVLALLDERRLEAP